jgi:hypothetical protein
MSPTAGRFYKEVPNDAPSKNQNILGSDKKEEIWGQRRRKQAGI